MAQRKKLAADARKEAKKSLYFAKLNDVPTSPRKMRLVADMIRGMEVYRALGTLHFSAKEASNRLEKLLRSAIANWEQKTELKAEQGVLYVSNISVDGAGMLKRLRTAPQGRGYRIRKRSNHVTIFVDTIKKDDSNDLKTVEDGTKD
ncbi:MAG: 50S ribosomal protein L22 [Paludibacteraceae bacterium]|nr:50S ribosomal protein L22 [Paludibacteraceae bacterium]